MTGTSFYISNSNLSLNAFNELLTTPNLKIEPSKNTDFLALIEHNRKFLENLLENEADLYGITTGFGNSSSQKLSVSSSAELQKNLVKYHGCGSGPNLSYEECKLTLLIRINCLAKGFSGITLELLNKLCELWNNDWIPVIPSRGSVGASGDLTPLSYIAAVLQGERLVYTKDGIQETKEVFKSHNYSPYCLKPKEGLAIMNGTSVMSSIALLSWYNANKFKTISSHFSAILVELLDARTSPFCSELHELKPHQGQKEAAKVIYDHLLNPASRFSRDEATDGQRLQDSYSIRCVPHIIGVLGDILDYTKKWIETEINSSNDNPLFDHTKELVLNGGHFFGGYIAAACDHLKVAVANVLGLMDKQLAILIDSRLNGNKFHANLIDKDFLGENFNLNHGLKALQISLSALASESFSLCSPVSIHSRSTECLNQDVVSLGTIAARQLSQVLELAKEGMGIFGVCLAQSCYLKNKKSNGNNWMSNSLKKIADSYFKNFEPILLDRQLDFHCVRISNDIFNATKNI